MGVTITKRSFQEMRLNLDAPVSVAFKSSAIKTF